MLADGPYGRLDASGSTSGGGSASPRPTRSSWPHSPDYAPDIELFARIREGLISGEHLERMGMALWLYEYLHLRCYFTGPHAGTSVATFTHVDAAKHLGLTTRQVKRWMHTLVEGGYVTTVRAQYGLTVSITKYGSCEATRAAGTVIPNAATRDRKVTREQSPTNPEVTFPVGTRDRKVTRDLPRPLEELEATSKEVTFPVRRSDIPVTADRLPSQSPVNREVTFLASRSDIPVTADPLPNQSPTDPEVTFPGAEVTFPVRRSDISGQPLLYVARTLRDSEISETPPPLPPPVPHRFRGASLPGLHEEASTTGLPGCPETGRLVAPPRDPSSPWGLVTAEFPVIAIPPVVSPPVSPPTRQRASRAKAGAKVVTVAEAFASGSVPEPSPVVTVRVAPDGEPTPRGSAPLAIVLSRPMPEPLPDAGDRADARTGASVTVLDRDGQVIDPEPGTAFAVAVQALPALPALPAVPEVRKYNRIGHVIDLLRAADLPDALSPQDMRAIKGSALEPGQLVACFGSLFLREWGTPWDWEHLDMAYAIRKWVPYQHVIRARGGKVSMLQDLLDAAFVLSDLNAADTAAVLRSSLSAEEIAEAYLGLHKGTWGSDFDRNRIGVTFVIDNFAKYEVSLRKRDRDPTAKRTRDEQTQDAWEIFDRALGQGNEP